jgi:hypothetical protein
LERDPAGVWPAATVRWYPARMTLAAILRHLAFAAALALLSAAVVRAMIAVRVLDRPDPRKVHTRDTPKGGGVGVVAAFLVGIAVLYRFAEFARLADPYFIGVIEASVAIAVVAFLDDLFDWKFTVKLRPRCWPRWSRWPAASTCWITACPMSDRCMSAGWALRRPSYGCCSPPTP